MTMNRMKMRWVLAPGIAVAIVLGISPAAEALDPETLAAIRAVSAVGAAASSGEYDARTLGLIVTAMRRDGASHDELYRLFSVLAGHPSPAPGSQASRGMGRFVTAALARGLRGRALAEAIHQEQARRGMPSHGAVIIPRAEDVPSRKVVDPAVVPPGLSPGAAPPGRPGQDRERHAPRAKEGRP